MKICKNSILKILNYIILILVFLMSPTLIFAGYLDQIQPAGTTPAYILGEVIVKFKDSSLNLSKVEGLNKMQVAVAKEQILYSTASSLETEENIELQDTLTSGNLGLYKTTNSESIEDLITRLKKNPNVEYVEPNYIYEPATISTNDTYKDLLWGLDNTGQTIVGINTVTGTVDADMDVPEAWAINNDSTNTPVIVADIDNGVAYNHPDLVATMWDGTNCKDENGLFLGDCVHGYNFTNNTKTPFPVNEGVVPMHGTHIAGTIGATKNNGMGIVGLTQNAKIIALSTGYTNDNLIKAINFARENGAKVINASWGNTSYSTFMYEAIKRFTDSGGIFIAAAHNYTRNNDITPMYPASYNIDGIISIAATDQNDNIASYSDWGLTSVDVAAPGSNIYSTYCSTDCSTQSYGYMYGTSMATPQVVGLAALIWGNNPTLSNLAVKNIILSTGDTLTSLNGKVLTGKRVNAFNALNSLTSLSSYIPNAGYINDGVIPASEISYASDTGIVTINFKIKDTYTNIIEQLSDFSYSIDDGVTWHSPINGDNSFSLSNDWKGNNYISSIDYSGATYNFTFNSKNIESTGINNTTTNNTMIRFKINDGINTSAYVTSESFAVDNYSFDLNIFQPSTPISINSNTFNIIGSTLAGSLVQVYRDITLVGSLQLDPTDTEFDISVGLDQNTVNNFTVKATEPVYNSEKIVTLPEITESDVSPYSLGWIEQTGSGLHSWRSIASSSDGKKLIAADGDIGNPYRETYLYTSINGGFTWTRRDSAGAYNWASVASSSDGTKLVAVAGGDYDLGYIKISTDSGATWTTRTSSLGALRWQSVTSSYDGIKLIAVTGGRYSNGYIYTSTDSGITWVKQNGAGLHRWMSLDSSSDGVNLVSVSGGPYSTGYIYTSTDSGATWTEQTSAGPRSWYGVTSSSDGTKLAAVAYSGYIYTSTDSGATWTEQISAGPRSWYGVTSSSNGTKLAAAAYNGYIYTSTDFGATWTEQTSAGSRSWYSIASSADGTKLVAGNGQDGYIYANYNNINTPPTITTSSATLLTTTTATLNGNITATTGGVSPTIRGFNYGLTTSYGTDTIENGTFSTGAYTSDITSLTCGTIYHYRSYTTNSIGTSYGNDMTFTTSVCPAQQYTLTYIASSYGTITGTSLQTVSSGNNGTPIIAVPDFGYHFVNWSDSSTSNPRTDINVLGNISVTANFMKDVITHSGGGGGGSVTLSPLIPIIPTEISDNCKLGDLFDTTTGLPCSTTPVKTDTTCRQGDIFNIYTGQKCTFSTSQITYIPAFTFTRNLKQGMTGLDVKDLQIYLNTHNFPISLSGLGSLNNETTYFGSLTKKAVIKFQLANALMGDGIVGSITRGKMK